MNKFIDEKLGKLITRFGALITAGIFALCISLIVYLPFCIGYFFLQHISMFSIWFLIMYFGVSIGTAFGTYIGNLIGHKLFS